MHLGKNKKFCISVLYPNVFDVVSSSDSTLEVFPEYSKGLTPSSPEHHKKNKKVRDFLSGAMEKSPESLLEGS